MAREKRGLFLIAVNTEKPRGPVDTEQARCADPQVRVSRPLVRCPGMTSSPEGEGWASALLPLISDSMPICPAPGPSRNKGSAHRALGRPSHWCAQEPWLWGCAPLHPHPWTKVSCRGLLGRTQSQWPTENTAGTDEAKEIRLFPKCKPERAHIHRRV